MIGWGPGQLAGGIRIIRFGGLLGRFVDTKQVVSFFLVCWTIFAVMYHVDAGEPIASSAQNAFFDSEFPLTKGEAIRVHNLLKKGGYEIKNKYEAIEEEPEFQREMFEALYRNGKPKWHDTLLSLEKLQNNLTLAKLIFLTADKIPYSTKSTLKFVPENLASNIYQDKTSSKSNKSLEECRSIANMMLKYLLLRREEWSPIPDFFKSYLGVANAEDVEKLCGEILESIPVLVEGAIDKYSGLRSICLAIQKNPNMQTAFAHPSVFNLYRSECYKMRGFCTDEELREMMVPKFCEWFDLKDTFGPRNMDKLLDYKLRKTDFNETSLAFKRFAVTYGESFPPASAVDRDRLIDLIPTPLKDRVLEVFRKATPEKIQNMLAKGSLEEERLFPFLEFLEYEPYNYLDDYGKIAESEERQVKIYKLFLRGKSQYDNNLVVPTKFRNNLLLFGLIFVKHNRENREFWENFSNVHVTPFSENKSGAVEDKEKGEGKEEEKEKEKEKGNEEEKQQLFVQQDMGVTYYGDYFSERVDDKVFADMYQTMLGEQRVGKQLVMIMLRDALANYNRVSKISEKLVHFVLVADADGKAQLLQMLLDTKSNAPEILDWIKHLENLKANPNYIAAIVQPGLFKITQEMCFGAAGGCTDKDLRAILLEFSKRDRLRYWPKFCINLRRLSFGKIAEIFKDLFLRMGRSLNAERICDLEKLNKALPKLKLLMLPIGSEQEKLDIHDCSSARERLFTRPRFLPTLRAMRPAERHIFQNITDEGVIEMFLHSYNDLPQDPDTKDHIAQDFAPRIIEWLCQNFSKKFPGHFLVDTLETVKPDPIAERWIHALGHWYWFKLLRTRDNFVFSLGDEGLLHRIIVELVMLGLGNAEKAIRAQVVAEAGGFTDHKTRQLVSKALAEFSNSELSEMFSNASNKHVRLFMIQPRLFHAFEFYSYSTQDRNIFRGLLTTGMVSKYVLKWLEQLRPGTQDVLLELLVKHERPLRWSSQKDWAILEEALIKSDPECYKMVDLDLSDWEMRLVTGALYVDCSQFTTFKEVEAAVREKVRSILGRQLEIEYGERYGNGFLSKVADPNLKAMIFFNQAIFGTVLDKDQSFEEAMSRVFFDRCSYFFPEKIGEELRGRADSVTKAISDWYHLYTETKYGLAVNLSNREAVKSCTFYVLLSNEIAQGPNQTAYQELLSKRLRLFLGLIGLNNFKEIMEHYQSVDQLRRMFKTSLRDPAAKLAMMQPLLKVPAPWSLADFREAISNDVPEGLFRDRLAIAPAGLFFKALGKYMKKNRDLFDPQKAEDREILERLMIKEDRDCVNVIMHINGLSFIGGPEIKCQKFNSYQDVSDELQKRLPKEEEGISFWN
jgi:hypothetical protein